MKTIICEKYGSPATLKVKEIDRSKPKRGEVLIKIHSCNISIGDTIIRKGYHPDSKFYTIMLRLVFGLFKPRKNILGMEISGKVVEVGENVRRFNINDKVFGSTFKLNFGGYSEYKCIPEKSIFEIIPENLSFEEAAAIPGGGMTALQCLKKDKIKSNDKILIIGASGSVGSSAVQIAKSFDAKVTAVCSSKNSELVKQLGADEVIEYDKTDYFLSNEKYDIIFDAVAKITPSKLKRMLKPDGKYINVLKHSGGGDTIENLRFLVNLVKKDKLKPVIDRTYNFLEIEKAHEYVENGHKKGNVVLNIQGNI